MTLVLRLPAETLLARRQEAAVFDRRGAELTRQDDGVDQHYGDVALLQVRLDLLNRHRTVENMTSVRAEDGVVPKLRNSQETHRFFTTTPLLSALRKRSLTLSSSVSKCFL